MQCSDMIWFIFIQIVFKCVMTLNVIYNGCSCYFNITLASLVGHYHPGIILTNPIIVVFHIQCKLLSDDDQTSLLGSQ